MAGSAAPGSSSCRSLPVLLKKSISPTGELLQSCLSRVRTAAAMHVHAVGAATGSAEDAPGLQPRNASPDGCSCPLAGLGRSSARSGAEVLVRELSDRCNHPGVGVDVGENGEALAFADPDNAVSGGHGHVVGVAGQSGRDPQQVAPGSATTCTFTPGRRCSSEKSAHLSPTRSHAASVPSSGTQSGSVSRRTLSTRAPGGRGGRQQR